MQNIVLPILLGAMGWLFTNTIEDFSKSQVITYNIEYYENNTEVKLKNISPTRENVTFRIRITCNDSLKECFSYLESGNNNTQQRAEFKHFQPNLSNCSGGWLQAV